MTATFNLIKILLILGMLVLIACDRSQAVFEKTRQLNTVEAYNSFIEKYSNNQLSKEATNLRDQLAFEMTADSTTTDSLAPLKINALENLTANAEQTWLKAEKNLDNIEAAEEFSKAGRFYQRAAKIHKLVDNDTTGTYKKAAYAYYKAAKRSQAAQMNAAISALNSWLAKPGRFSVGTLQTSMAISTFPHHLEKSLLYDQSAELFRKAGMEKHAEWMLEGGTIKTFKLSELEIIPDSVGTKQINEK